MSNIVYPNIGSINADTEDKSQSLIGQPKPQITINNNIQIEKEPEVKKEQPSDSEMEKWGKRVKISAWIFVVVGAISAIKCVIAGFHARNITEMVLSGWGWRHHHNYPLPDSIDRDEFAITDIIRIVCFTGFFVSCMLLCTGKKALKAVHMQKPGFVHCQIKCIALRCVFMILLSIFMHHKGKEGVQHYVSYRHRHNQTVEPQILEFLHGRKHNYMRHEKYGRKLSEVDQLDFFKQINDQNGCEAKANRDLCDADTSCTWCASFAVKSGCKTINDAKSLPPSIFACDNFSSEEEEVKEEEEKKDFIEQITNEDDVCSVETSENSCDAVSSCTWCASFAVKSGCKTMADAKSLPPSIFACDKMTKMEEAKKQEEKKDFIEQITNEDDECAVNADEDGCDAVSSCTWCASFAVKSSCKSMTTAKSLPPAIFACDKVNSEKKQISQSDRQDFLKKIQWKTESDRCRHSFSSESSCDLDSGCTWCKSVAVASSCNSIADARSLPPAVFACDKMTTEKKQLSHADRQGFWKKIHKTRRSNGCTYSSEKTCDDDSDCAWCESGAVPDACYSLDEAENLPPSIFGCEKRGMEEAASAKPMLMPHFRFKQGHHDKHHRRGMCFIKLLLAVNMALLMYFLKKYEHALVDFIQAGGILKNKWTGKVEDKKETLSTQPTNRPVFEYSIVDHDKQFPQVVAPQPQMQTYRVEKEAQQMV